jgi:hypothetical protein
MRPGSNHKKLLMRTGNPQGSRFTRCSRPLCSSQTTTPSHPPHAHPGNQPCNVYGLGHARDNRNNVHQAPPQGCPMSCCLRTQQCAKDPNTPTDRFFPTRKRAYSNRRGRFRTGPQFVDIPPMSARRTTQGSATGNTEHPRTTTGGPPPGVSCSLERR